MYSSFAHNPAEFGSLASQAMGGSKLEHGWPAARARRPRGRAAEGSAQSRSSLGPVERSELSVHRMDHNGFSGGSSRQAGLGATLRRVHHLPRARCLVCVLCQEGQKEAMLLRKCMKWLSCCNKSSPTGWFNRTWFSRSFGSQGLRSRCQQGHTRSEGSGENPPCLVQLLLAPGIPGPGVPELQPLPLSSSVSGSASSSLPRTCHWIESPPRPRYSHLQLHNLPTSAQILLPDKVIFTGSWWMYLWSGGGGTIQPTASRFLPKMMTNLKHHLNI